MNKTYFSTSEKVTVNNYPYGRLQCEATFGVEFDPKKGFRTVFQTVNPKNGTINKPKKSTFVHGILLMYRNETNGHIEFEGKRYYDKEDVNTNAKFLAEHYEKFTLEQIKYLAQSMWNQLVIDAVYTHRLRESAKGFTLLEFKAKYYQKPMDVLKDIFTTGANRFSEVYFDYEIIDKECPKND